MDSTNRPSRRQFINSVGLGLAAVPAAAAWLQLFSSSSAIGAEQPAAESTSAKPNAKRKRLALVTTLWTYGTHAWHMPERFLHGYPVAGRWHHPEVEIVAAYVDQRPKGDLSASRAEEFGFKVYPTVAEALRVGGDKLAVDGVVLIGEHGVYSDNEYGQKFYPRYELFKKIVEVYRADGRAVPIFNDKHLSWNFDYAKEMVDTARELKFPLQAGSSLPVTWRMPAIELPDEAELEEALVVAYGGLDSYDFHGLETLQCFIERRRGGETGVVSVRAVRGDEAWQLIERSRSDAPGIDPELFEACLSRTHTLTQPETFSHRLPTSEQMRKFVKDPVAFQIRYADGLRATLLMMNGLVRDFTVAARLKAPLGNVFSTQMHLPPNPNVAYSAALMWHAERMYVTGKTQYPIERTLLTSGVLQSCLQSLYKKQELQTPHLNISYKPTAESTFFRS